MTFIYSVKSYCVLKIRVKLKKKIKEEDEIEIISSYDIGKVLNIDHKAVLNHLEKAGYKEKFDVWAPRDLTLKNFTNRISLATHQKIDLDWKVSMHPPYNSDLAPSDYIICLSQQNSLNSVASSKETRENHVLPRNLKIYLKSGRKWSHLINVFNKLRVKYKKKKLVSLLRWNTKLTFHSTERYSTDRRDYANDRESRNRVGGAGSEHYRGGGGDPPAGRIAQLVEPVVRQTNDPASKCTVGPRWWMDRGNASVTSILSRRWWTRVAQLCSLLRFGQYGNARCIVQPRAFAHSALAENSRAHQRRDDVNFARRWERTSRWRLFFDRCNCFCWVTTRASRRLRLFTHSISIIYLPRVSVCCEALY